MCGQIITNRWVTTLRKQALLRSIICTLLEGLGNILAQNVHTETLMHAFFPVVSTTACQLSKLQRVQNSAARHVFEESKFCHITPLIKSLLVTCKVSHRF